MTRSNRRSFLHTIACLGVSVGGVALLSSGCGLLSMQIPRRISHIGYLATTARDSTSLPAVQANAQAFLDGLSQYGWAEGQNVAIDWRSSDGHDERYPALAAELVALPVDLILASSGTPGTLAAKQATTTIPIVFANLANPFQTGIVQSLARPGGNITGTTQLTPELVGKRLGLLHELVPGLSKVAYLRNPDTRPGMRTSRTFG